MHHLISQSVSAKDFLENFGQRFAHFRGKPGAVWFEKTPENINRANDFLTSFPASHFVHIVRNPLYVARSLFYNRGFPIGLSLFTWLYDVAHVLNITNTNLITVKYEDLVANPWAKTAEILTAVCKKEIDSQLIYHGYHNNTYRKSVSKKIQSWGVNSYGEVQDANKVKIQLSFLAIFKSAIEYKIDESWADAYNLPCITYKDAISHFGYDAAINDALINVEASPSQLVSFQDFRRVLLKKKALIVRNTGKLDFHFTPIIKC